MVTLNGMFVAGWRVNAYPAWVVTLNGMFVAGWGANAYPAWAVSAATNP
ncbi:Hypothetical protein ABZS17G119_03874 [Kosakonia cowanii]